MKPTLIGCLVFFLCEYSLCFNFQKNIEYKNWTYGDRTSLKCPITWCEMRHPTRIESCCVCYAKPSWELDGSLYSLSLEYVRRSGLAVIIGENKPSELIHQKGMLKALPLNICDFTGILKLDLRFNFLSSVLGVSCLADLDTLDVSNNNIRYLSNKTFQGMSMLRVLKIAHNGLEYIEPYTIANVYLTLFHVDLSYNNQTILDISNIIPENHFCKYDFTSNEIKDFVNGGNFQLDVDKTYEGGLIELIGNNFNEFFDFKELGIDDILILGKVLNFGFSFLDANMTCNCLMQPYLKLAEEVIKRIWRDYFNITCAGPPELKGQSIVDIVKENRLDQLICVISESQKCPRHCRCYEQPNQNRTVVDCSSRGLLNISGYIPEKYNITYNLRNNSLQVLDNQTYLVNVTSIDVSQNFLTTISEHVVMTLKDNSLTNLTLNKFTYLNRSFQTFNPCITHFGNVTINCDCGSIWIPNWLKNKNNDKCLNVTNITCMTLNGLVPAMEIQVSDICEKPNNLFEILISLICIVVTIALMIFGTLYIYRYELYILRRKCFPGKLSKVSEIAKYDAYISFYEGSPSIRQWVVKYFDYQLMLRGYKTFIPCRDTFVGTALEESISIGVSSSKHYIVMLCKSYLSEDSVCTAIEWKYIWNNFRQNQHKNIIVINFGLFDSSAIMNRKMKAFIRLGMDLDFSNRTHSLVKDVSHRLGPPMLAKRKKDVNAKTKLKSGQWKHTKTFKNKINDIDYLSVNVIDTFV